MAPPVKQFNLPDYELLPPADACLAMQGLQSALCARGMCEPESYRLFRHVRRMTDAHVCTIVEIH